ncbi:homogentisate 1,2-dioxygenase [Panus rudis PR-1116 ss-1]|nr:homogentisate 1,2-dioxygenase [Panus rudis PR-1116 ss-1]
MATQSVTADSGYVTSGDRTKDPYNYQVGFGNSFASEALPGVLPVGQNSPQKVKYDLYAEGINGSPFVAPRAVNRRTWFYRIQPSVAHDGFSTAPQNPLLESDFSASNPKVHLNPAQIAWSPFELPKDSVKVDFIDGLKTIGGSGGAVQREGVAVHIYTANTSMGKKAFVNSDGDFLIIPQIGRLDVQTEVGKMMVRPGEIVVIQSGLKFKVSLPDGASRGYVQEIFGSHFELPELGPLGANGLANIRDFEHPVASFDVDQSNWDIIYKAGGVLFKCQQDHTPFDVVAWHGNYVPYKYALEKFIVAGNVNRDHADPSTFCVLTVKSKVPGIALVDFCAIVPRWEVTTDTFRPPYFHRNTAAELIGFIYGARREPAFQDGAINYRTSFSPHGVTSDQYEEAREEELVPTKLGEGSLAFLIEPSVPLLFTDFALKSNNFFAQDVGPYRSHGPLFLRNIDQVNSELKALGRPELHISC